MTQWAKDLLLNMYDWAKDVYYDIKAIMKMCRRAAVWGWRLRKNYEWDYSFLLEMEVLKLQELLYYFEHYGYHDPECETYKPKMKSLRLAIKLGDLLLKDEYMKFYDLYTKKWGEAKPESRKITEGHLKGHYQLIWLRDGKEWKPSEQERKELGEAWEKDTRREQKHRSLFYRIIAVHGQRWWD